MSKLDDLSLTVGLVLLSVVLNSRSQSLLAAVVVVVKSSPTTTISSSSPSSSLPSSKSSSSSSRGEPVNDYDDDERFNQLWLDDFETEFSEGDDDGLMLADSPPLANAGADEDSSPAIIGNGRGDKDAPGVDAPACPPPPSQLPSFSCDAEKCLSDLECDPEKLCCFNGCRYTCMIPVQTVPYTDWKRQPQRRLVSGSSWLVPGPVERDEVEWCTTSEVFVDDDEEPLLCPHGYFCLVEDEGDAANGVPNRGICVLQVTETLSKESEEEEEDLTQTIDCTVGETKHRNGSTFLLETQTCDCHLGSVLCHVGRRNQSHTIGSVTQDPTEAGK